MVGKKCIGAVWVYSKSPGLAAALEIKQIRFTRTKEFPPDPPIFPFPDKISAKKKQRPHEGVWNNLKKYHQSIKNGLYKLKCLQSNWHVHCNEKKHTPRWKRSLTSFDKRISFSTSVLLDDIGSPINREVLIQQKSLCFFYNQYDTYLKLPRQTQILFQGTICKIFCTSSTR